MPKVHIHFICRGNVYRSRLAELYLKSKQNRNIKVSSSGIDAHQVNISDVVKLPLLITNDTGDMIRKNHLWRQTTQKIINSADLIIFMSHDVAKDAKCSYEIIDDKTEIWNISNLDNRDFAIDDAYLRKKINNIYKHVDKLIHAINVTGMVDVVDDNNHLKGYSIPLSWVNQKNLRYRSCHGIIVVDNKKILSEKRSHKIIFSPDLLDITFGGAVNQGEEPLETLHRECYEELGIIFNNSNVTLLGISKFNTYHPRYKLHTKCFLYSYLIKLQSKDVNINLEQKEVSNVYSLSLTQVSRLIKYHHISHVGWLNTSYKYYEDTFEQVKKLLN